MKGWVIIPTAEEKPRLEVLGLKFGQERRENGALLFEGCSISVQDFKKLEPLYGRIFWGFGVNGAVDRYHVTKTVAPAMTRKTPKL